MCTPVAVPELALGFAYFAGAIGGLPDVLALEEAAGQPARVMLQIAGDAPLPPRVVPAAGGQAAPYTSKSSPRVPPFAPPGAADVVESMRSLHACSALHHAAGGTHASALSDGRSLLALYEDIGRHNTIDKLMGHCLITGLPSSGLMLLTSGRLSSEMVHKSLRMQVSAIVSRSTPTDMALSLAQAAGLTVYGYVRGDQLTVFCGELPRT